MPKDRVHVVKRSNGWAVRRQGASKASGVFRNQRDARNAAENYRNKGSDVIIHKSDGSIHRWRKGK
ncbi:DUF2188 domain-containing protein [Candidatus Gracilibacteria bacterium]|nr:DUF2188 domain-containing protein [Candidatus Gracilibacteria bacterium]